MKKYINIFVLTLILYPTIASAQLTGVKDLITSVSGLINPLIALAVALALLAFFWGLAKFIFRVGGDEKAVEDGKRVMKWGLLALFIMLSIGGIIALIQEDLGINSGDIGGERPI